MTLLFLWLKRREKKTPKHQTRILTLKNISVQTEDSLQVITNSRHLISCQSQSKDLRVLTYRRYSVNICTNRSEYSWNQKSVLCLYKQVMSKSSFLPFLSGCLLQVEVFLTHFPAVYLTCRVILTPRSCKYLEFLFTKWGNTNITDWLYFRYVSLLSPLLEIYIANLKFNRSGRKSYSGVGCLSLADNSN